MPGKSSRYAVVLNVVRCVIYRNITVSCDQVHEQMGGMHCARHKGAWRPTVNQERADDPSHRVCCCSAGERSQPQEKRFGTD